MWRIALLLAPALLALAGCLSINRSEPTVLDTANSCSDREQQCRNLCGNAGVQSFRCSNRPGEGYTYQCDCRRLGTAG